MLEPILCFNLRFSHQIRGAVTVVSLLGITWVLGPFSIGWARLPLHYLFCITTPLQGLIIFIVRVVQHNEAKKSWINFLKTGSIKQRPKTPHSSFHTNSSINMNTSINSQTMLANGTSQKSSLTSSLSSMVSSKKPLTASLSSGNNRDKNSISIRKRSYRSNSSYNSVKRANPEAPNFVNQILSHMTPNRRSAPNPVPSISNNETANNSKINESIIDSSESSKSKIHPEYDRKNVQHLRKLFKEDNTSQDPMLSLPRSNSDGELNKAERSSFSNFIERQQYFDNLLYAKQNKRFGSRKGQPVMGSGQSLGSLSISPTLNLSEYCSKTDKPVLFSPDQHYSHAMVGDSVNMKNVRSEDDNRHQRNLNKFKLSKHLGFLNRKLFTTNRNIAKETSFNNRNGTRSSMDPSMMSDYHHRRHQNEHSNGRGHQTSSATQPGTGGVIPRTASDYQMWHLNVRDLTEYRKGEAILRRCISSNCLANGGALWSDAASSYA